ncbi:hypothetical protein PLICRDRAFT_52718 [Plicaturopsis crispa FD-325 SS-3]|nr:hypothetical protein PLICRDRAFT_52718 [Plicaturopsis crispa FD-325 SS-3]
MAFFNQFLSHFQPSKTGDEEIRADGREDSVPPSTSFSPSFSHPHPETTQSAALPRKSRPWAHSHSQGAFVNDFAPGPSSSTVSREESVQAPSKAFTFKMYQHPSAEIPQTRPITARRHDRTDTEETLVEYENLDNNPASSGTSSWWSHKDKASMKAASKILRAGRIGPWDLFASSLEPDRRDTAGARGQMYSEQDDPVHAMRDTHSPARRPGHLVCPC